MHCTAIFVCTIMPGFHKSGHISYTYISSKIVSLQLSRNPHKQFSHNLRSITSIDKQTHTHTLTVMYVPYGTNIVFKPEAC